MTFKTLMNFGNHAKDPYRSPIDRFHSGSGGYHHDSYHHGGYHHGGSGGYHHSGSGGYHHGSRGSYKGKGGSGAALSALTLLAFLFLINVMQQSLQDNNSTMAPTMMTTVMLREGDQPVVLDAKEEKESKKRDEVKRDSSYRTPAKSKIQRLNNQYIK